MGPCGPGRPCKERKHYISGSHSSLWAENRPALHYIATLCRIPEATLSSQKSAVQTLIILTLTLEVSTLGRCSLSNEICLINLFLHGNILLPLINKSITKINPISRLFICWHFLLFYINTYINQYMSVKNDCESFGSDICQIVIYLNGVYIHILMYSLR